jgi:hypothetical protein
MLNHWSESTDRSVACLARNPTGKWSRGA